MKFIDEIDIYVSSGCGGNGLVSFSKIKNTKITPDGGNGGYGGNVYIRGNKNCITLYNLNFRATYKAQNGLAGGKNRKTGKNGKNLYICVPLGTVIFDNERKIHLGEIIKHEETLIVTKGGRGGIGNHYFKNKNINKLNIGSSSEVKFLHLELYMLAHIGLFGYPNAGKSMFLNTFTNANSKIASYAFTTLSPYIGDFKYNSKQKIIIADVPGVIKNASLNKGLGFKFLKHLSKTKLLFHIFDLSSITNDKQFLKNIIIINKELIKFDNALFKKEKWLIINKIDLIKEYTYENFFKKISKKFNYKHIFFVSLLNKIGLKKLSFNIKEYFLKTI